jgi:isochorismate synthase
VTTFHRHRLEGVDLAALRAVAARSGWLVETNDWLRAGFGAAVATVSVEGGVSVADTCRPFDGLELARDGGALTAFAAAPFDRRGVLCAWVPEHVVSVSSYGDAWLTSTSPDPTRALTIIAEGAGDTLDTEYEVVAATFAPSPDGYARAVAAAVEEIRHSDLEKVVLARRVIGRTDQGIDPAVVVTRLHEREPACTLYAVPGGHGDRFVGASPELLVASHDGQVSAHPLAGTVALPEESDARDYATWLLGSTKNLYEHRVVVDDIVDRLASLCVDVHAEERPSIVTLRSVAHLGTWIHGKMRDDRPATSLDLLGLLHPTPAVGGLPRAHALEVIERLEPEDRGLYAGAVGWFDTAGNGEWWVAIRGVLVRGDEFEAWAGAGIVADSDPIAEREETRDKLASVLAGLGRVER